MSSQDPAHTVVEWNRLNKTNAEDALAKTFFTNVISATYSLDSYSSWFSAGTGASIVLAIGNSSQIITLIGSRAFRWSVGLLVASCLCGAIAKLFSAYCQFLDRAQPKIDTELGTALDKFYADQKKIIDFANDLRITLITDFSMANVIAKFLAPFPKWQQWLIGRYLAKHAENPQIGFLLPIKFFRWQGNAFMLQVALAAMAIALAIVNI